MSVEVSKRVRVDVVAITFILVAILAIAMNAWKYHSRNILPDVGRLDWTIYVSYQ